MLANVKIVLCSVSRVAVGRTASSAPACGSVTAWRLETKLWTWECRDSARQTSVTTGTIMHGSKVPLRTWFLAAHLLATHSNGMSAMQLQAKLNLGSYKTAWLLLHKLRRAKVDPARSPPDGDVEVDETTIPSGPRTSPSPVARAGARSARSSWSAPSNSKKATSLAAFGCGRIRLGVVPDYRGEMLKGFIRVNVARGSHIWTDDNKSYYGLDGYGHTPRVVGKMAHVIMPWIHRAFSNAKRWGSASPRIPQKVPRRAPERVLFAGTVATAIDRRSTDSLESASPPPRRHAPTSWLKRPDEWNLVAPMRGWPISDPHPAFVRRIVHRVGRRVGKPGN